MVAVSVTIGDQPLSVTLDFFKFAEGTLEHSTPIEKFRGLNLEPSEFLLGCVKFIVQVVSGSDKKGARRASWLHRGAVRRQVG
jgi:hypothetical protein